jgi:hypothetical protein
MFSMTCQTIKIRLKRTIRFRSLYAVMFMLEISSAVIFALAMPLAAKSSPVDDLLFSVFKPVDELLSKENDLKYGDYELKRSAVVIEKSHDLYRAEMVLNYKGQIIRTVQSDIGEMGLNNFDAWYRFGIYPLLGEANNKQILMMEYTGGAHCCWSYGIYASSPEPVEIYSTEKWELGNEMRYADPDHDGVFEISQSVMVFDYFDRCCHAASAMPWIVFKYDKARAQYLPANDLFAEDLLKDTDKNIADLNRVSVEKDDSGGFFLGAVLNIVLPHIYAGRENEGWQIFDQVYKLPDKAEMKSKIKAKLKEDRIYNYLYETSRPQPGGA